MNNIDYDAVRELEIFIMDPYLGSFKKGLIMLLREAGSAYMCQHCARGTPLSEVFSENTIERLTNRILDKLAS